jgi:tetratricopeptide (TPR) repeat protein
VANTYLGGVHHVQGEYQRAMDCCLRTVAALDAARRHERFGQLSLPAVLARTWLAWCAAEVGTFAEGIAMGEEGCRIAEAVGHRVSLVFAYWGAGLPYLHQGDLSQALPLLERAMDICQDADLPLIFPWVASPLGLAYALSGRVTDALPLLVQAIEQSAALGRWGYHALFVATLGKALLLAGRLEEAHHHAGQALDLARVHKERGNEAYALRLTGEIMACSSSLDAEQAEAHYRQALALAEELGMRPLQAHCHYGLGTLYRQTGRAALARAALSTAIEMYRVMDMTFWLPAAEAALAEVA